MDQTFPRSEPTTMTHCPTHQVPLIEQPDGSTSVCPSCSGRWMSRASALAIVGPYHRPSDRRATRLPCPEDGAMLRAQKLPRAPVLICPECGGVWVEKEAFEAAKSSGPAPRTRPSASLLIFVSLIAITTPIAALYLLKGAVAAAGDPYGWPAMWIGGTLGLGALGLCAQAVKFLFKHRTNGDKDR